MDFFSELESMAQAAAEQSGQPDEPTHEDVKRWQSLFGFSYAQALKEIQDHRSDLSRPRVSESHWEIVRAQKEAEGFDKEAYEFSGKLRSLTPSTIPATGNNQHFLLRLEGPIETLEVVKLASQLKGDPPIYHGTDDDGKPAKFCKVDMAAKTNIFAYLSGKELRFQPTFVPYSMAAKELSTISAYPTLGKDTTMPQFRPNSPTEPILEPSQSQCPVWYFFYGTLADPAVLGRLLGVEPSYKDASVQGGILRTWGGKYKALVDSPGGTVHGSAFLVENKDQEDILRCYETEKYEVVRCEIHTGATKVRGLTFRFAGDT